MGWHQVGDEFENICRAKLLERWPGSRIIETKYDSVHGIDFAVHLPSGGIAIVEVKSATGAVRGQQMSTSWISERVLTNPALESAIIDAFMCRAPVFRATYRVLNTVPPQIRNAPPTDELSWGDLFGDREKPEKKPLQLCSAKSFLSGNVIRVTHQFTDGVTMQEHEYSLDIRQLSCALFDSTLEFNSFPFRVPHSHQVTENGRQTYFRTLDDWNEHLDSKEHLSSDNVETRHCAHCRILFYDTSDHVSCYPCWTSECRNNAVCATQLIDQANRWASSTDWKEAGNAIKRLQQDWKGIHPLPRDQADTLWERFNDTCQSFFNVRQQHYAQQDRIRRGNAERAQRLIAEAQRLARSTDWKEASDAIKGLQQTWKSVNPLPKDEADILWERFNSACQSFFEAKQQSFDQQDQIRRSNAQRAEKIIGQVEQLAQSTEWKEAGDSIKRLQQDWKSVHPLPKNQGDALWKRFNDVCQSFFNARQQHYDKQDRIRQNNLQRAKQLISQAEQLARSTDWKVASDDIKRLQQDWKSVHPLPKDKGDALWERFSDACQSFFSARSEAYERGQREWQERTSNALGKAQDALERLEESINHDEGLISRWQDTINNLRPGGRAEEIRYELERKIYEVQEKIDSKRDKIRDIEVSIADMQHKLNK